MRKPVFATIVFLSTGAALAAIAHRYHFEFSPSIHPLVAVYKITVSKQPSGQQGIVTDPDRYVTFAVRSDGATMQANAIPDAQGHIFTVRGIEFRDRYVIVDPLSQSVSSYQPRKPIVVPSQDCGGELDAPLLSHPTEVVTNQVNPNAKRPDPRGTKWLALDLNCVPLRERWIPNDGSDVVQVDREAISVEVGEPPAEYFDVPANYTERGPADVDSEIKERFGRHVFGDGDPAVLQRLQQSYQRGKPH